MFANVLVALEDPRMAHPALEEALGLAAKDGARVHVLLAVMDGSAGWFDLAGVPSEQDRGHEGLLIEAGRLLDAAAARVPSGGPRVSTEVVEGPLWPAVAGRVGSGAFDAVVLEAGAAAGERLPASARLYRLLGEGAPPAVLLVPVPDGGPRDAGGEEGGGVGAPHGGANDG